MTIEEKLQSMNIYLPQNPERRGHYASIKIYDNKLVFMSGCGSALDGVQQYIGKLGDELTIAQGKECARNCILNLLATWRQEIGLLDHIKQFLKMTVYVVCLPEFQDSPQVADGATELLEILYGKERLPARTAIGVNSLTQGFSVEIDIIAELYE